MLTGSYFSQSRYHFHEQKLIGRKVLKSETTTDNSSIAVTLTQRLFESFNNCFDHFKKNSILAGISDVMGRFASTYAFDAGVAEVSAAIDKNNVMKMALKTEMATFTRAGMFG